MTRTIFGDRRAGDYPSELIWEHTVADNLQAFLNRMAETLGAEWVNVSDETLYRYGENTLPGGDRRPSAVLYPGSTEDVQAIMRAATELEVVVHPISQGQNISIGTRSAMAPGQVVIDLGRRMNRIIEVNDELAFCEIEPGVSYQALHDELVRRGHKLMLDCTSGPPQGSVLGNAMDRGAGYTPYADHFGMTCGLEIVLPTGELVYTGERGGDGSMWHVSKYSFGPSLDGLFVQSNLGIVTRGGMWLMPRPPMAKAFHFSFPDDDDIEDIIALCRPLKMTNLVPTMFRISNDLWLIGEDAIHPEYAATGGKQALSDAARRALQAKFGLGAWTVSGAVYGASDATIDPVIERIRKHFAKNPKAKFISDAETDDYPGLGAARSVFAGVPTPAELRQLKWRPGGGVMAFTPGTPMDPKRSLEIQSLARSILERYGFEYISMWVAGARFTRCLHNIIFNRNDEDERQRADSAYRELAREFAARGYGVGRGPIDFHDQHAEDRDPLVNELHQRIKDVFDPKHILSPGRYGVR